MRFHYFVQIILAALELVCVAFFIESVYFRPSEERNHLKGERTKEFLKL